MYNKNNRKSGLWGVLRVKEWFESIIAETHARIFICAFLSIIFFIMAKT